MRKKGIRWVAKSMALLLTCATIVGGAVMMPKETSAAPIIDPAPTTGSLTINKKGTDKDTPLAGAEFSIYKVMSLTPGETAGEYAKYSIETAFADVLKGVTPDTLGNYSTTQLENKIQELKAVVDNGAAAAAGTQTTAEGSGAATFNNLALGYYLVVETKAPEGYVAGSPFLIAVPSTNNYNSTDAQGTEWVYDVAAEPKNAQISIEKTLGEAEDGSVKLDDYVAYEIKTTMPNYPDEYFDENVTFTISDIMSDGLSIQNTGAHPVKVYVNDEPVDAAAGTYSITAIPAEGENADLKIEFTKDYIKNHRGESVKVTYFAQVTAEAVMGNAGNPNKVTLTYNNKPGETTEAKTQEVKVYSFGIQVVKFAKEGREKALAGAEFELYSGEELSGAKKIGTATSDTDGKLSFPRLDDGIYWLKETKSPAGYTLLANPIKVEITATKDAQGVATGAFTLKVDGTSIEASASGDYVTKLDQGTGIASVAVENHKGFTLPTTGGMGIAIFLIIGAAGIIVISIAMSKKSKKNL